MRVFLAPAHDLKAAMPCVLLGINQGAVHLSTRSWIAPGTRALMRFEHLVVQGNVDYCVEKHGEYLTCVISDDGRNSPRFPVDEPGSLTVLSGELNEKFECRLTDLSRSGLGVDTLAQVEVGWMICVLTASMLAVGEVRHQRQNGDGSRHVGISVTDVISDQTAQRRKKGVRHRFAEVILGRRIGA